MPEAPESASYPPMRAVIEEILDLAEESRGSTSPNPPVAAAALDDMGRVLSLDFHRGAGTPHAEALVLEKCRAQGALDRVRELVVTLEPCNHVGRTPPCTEAILAVPSLRRVVFGIRDPNPRVAGGGAERLRKAGLQVVEGFGPPLGGADLDARARELIAPFSKWIRTGYPWVVVKTAHLPDGSMIPPPGRKTFTDDAMLTLAHQARKESDAILTGSGTVLADHPLFTVRRVPDRPSRRVPRRIVVMDRRGRVPESELARYRASGMDSTRSADDLQTVLKTLGNQGVVQVLVEAGPRLAGDLLGRGLWDRHLIIETGSYRQIGRDQLFTGIVQTKGRISRKAQGAEPTAPGLVLEVETGLGALEAGESVAVDGVCLTVEPTEGAARGIARFALSEETLERTALGALVPGSEVNLERALRFGDRLGGHWVQGHVDGMGRVLEIATSGEYRRVAFEVPRELARYCVEKGSVAVQGVSLTVNTVSAAGGGGGSGHEASVVSVMLVPHTLGTTTLGSLRAGDRVNVEVDILGKYVERLMMPWQKKETL